MRNFHGFFFPFYFIFYSEHQEQKPKELKNRDRLRTAPTEKSDNFEAIGIYLKMLKT